MALDSEICLLANSCKLIDGEADADFYDAMALCAGEMMMMAASADAVVVRPIGKFDAVQQTQSDQFLHSTVDRCSSQTRLVLSHCLPEIINREIDSAVSKFHQLLCDEPPWACIALTDLVERGIDFIR